MADLENSDPLRLASLLSIAPGATGLWRAGELTDVLRHQLECSLTLLGPTVEGISPAGDPPAPPLNTIGDVFRHPSPPIGTLHRIKEFANGSDAGSVQRLPSEVAAILYYLAIAKARDSHGASITTLADDQLLAGLRWAVARDWLDDPSRAILGAGLRLLEHGLTPSSDSPVGEKG